MKEYKLERSGRTGYGILYILRYRDAGAMSDYLKRASLPYVKSIEVWDPDNLHVWLNLLADEDDIAEFEAIVAGYFTGLRIIPRHFKKSTDFIPGKPDPKASWHQGGEVQ